MVLLGDNFDLMSLTRSSALCQNITIIKRDLINKIYIRKGIELKDISSSMPICNNISLFMLTRFFWGV